jgi:phage gpG-like protein
MVYEDTGERRGGVVKFSGSVSVKNKFAKFADFSRNMDKIMSQANGIAALEVRNEAVKLISENGDGEKVTRYGPKRDVHVSSPGDPPNADTGRLIQSIKVEKDGLAYLVGTNLKYGAYLEFGTKDIAPRPWLSVAVRNVSKDLPKIYELAFSNFTKAFKE